ncbi:MAG: TRAP transporter fused permease subunit [Paracoccaceae bacterium]|nr:TRAP transporter fused permease subunit [Paracoccaceae bacterium]
MNTETNIDALVEKFEGPGQGLTGRLALLVPIVGFIWSAWQLWIASPLPFQLGFGIFVDLPARGLHLAFGVLMGFLMFPSVWEARTRGRHLFTIALGAIAFLTCTYVWIGYDGIVNRDGILLELPLAGGQFPFEAVLAALGILFLLEATRRSVGQPLVIVCVVFLVYSVFGQSMPEIISHKGVSIERLVGYQWLSSEAVFGIPIDVSVSYVFLFVLFGAFMDKAGAGKFFLDVSFSLVGQYRGGPAKAAIMASGLTGTVSGSSIANTVTTGAFTIPLMKKMGLPAHKAGAIEVAASTNGQLMPPIMGASAFIIAEFIGISYYDVIVHAAIPAFISYCALFYISHLEAMKLGLRGLPKSETPDIWATLKGGIHFLIPIGVLIYLLLVERWSPGSAVFYAIVLMVGIIFINALQAARAERQPLVHGLQAGFITFFEAMVSGAKSMAGVTAAVGAAGIIVGAVSSTGLNNAMLSVIEAISQGNFYILLPLVAVVCLILGMGLPTTANYIVVASLMATVLVELGNASGLVIPLIAVHLYVLYFGLMADSTPPVCLAAFAASAISGANPMRTGVQSFLYDIRTAILPIVFIFNPELLLVGVTSIWHGLSIFVVSLIAILCFASITQGWLLTRLSIIERLVLGVVVLALFRPDFVMDRVYPQFAPLQQSQIATKELIAASHDRTLRLHATRETDYGDRYKLFILPPVTEDKRATTDTLAKRIGALITAEEDGRLYVSNTDFNGPGEKAGLTFGDYITHIDVEQFNRPAKEWVYPIGLLLLALVFFVQSIKLKRRPQVGEMSSGELS